jgi:diguanylate cyclase (GGDEF)-like protein
VRLGIAPAEPCCRRGYPIEQAINMPRTGLSLPAKIAGTLFLTLVSVALTALVLHQHQVAKAAAAVHRQQVMDWVELGAYQVGDTHDTADAPTAIKRSSDEEDIAALRRFRPWARSVLRRPGVIGAAFVGADGQVRAWEPDAVTVQGLDDVPVRDAAWSRRTLRMGSALREVEIVSRPVAPEGKHGAIGYLVLATLPPGIAGWAIPTLFFAGALAVVILVCAVGVYAWSRVAVGRPLALLADAKAWEGAGLRHPPLVDRPDELGAIARHLRRWTDRAGQCESRLAALQQTLSTRVADRTKRIETMLRLAQQNAWIDPLTTLYNRRFLDEKLEQLFRQQQAAGEDLTLVMFDLDHFKALNDTLGHSAGDEALAFLGELLRGSLRETDIAVRVGGDEFVVLLSGIGPAEAAVTADRIIRLFTQRASLFEVEPRMGVSAGVASTMADRAESGEHLWSLADAALYRAKGAGKNAVQVAARSSTSAAPGHPDSG